MGKTVIITLGVDARALYTAYPPSSTAPTQTQLDPYCHMNDDNDGSIQPPGGTVNDFTSQVYKGNTVRWRINRHDASAGGSYTVKIISIVNNSSPAFFD
ncbi:MAG: hypothetical protein OEQ81_11970, partial [Flavobacteriaceae bacterium]|nr:hypothetical protein [Flavobacteriaceae bacterium]